MRKTPKVRAKKGKLRIKQADLRVSTSPNFSIAEASDKIGKS